MYPLCWIFFGDCQKEVCFLSPVFVSHSLVPTFKYFALNALHPLCLCYSLAALFQRIINTPIIDFSAINELLRV